MNNCKREIPIAEKKLTQLAEKFIEFLENNPSEIIDINTAADILQIRNKKRISDIISILEGIDLIEKVDKNKIIWRGNNKNNNDVKFHRNHIKLTEEIKKLDELLAKSESNIKKLKQSIKNTTTEPENIKYSYITKKELEGTWQDKNLILIMSSDQINISFPKVDHDIFQAKEKYKIKINRFTNEPIIFYLPIKDSLQPRYFKEIENTKLEDNIFVNSEEIVSKIIDIDNYNAHDILTHYESALDAFNDF